MDYLIEFGIGFLRGAIITAIGGIVLWLAFYLSEKLEDRHKHRKKKP